MRCTLGVIRPPELSREPLANTSSSHRQDWSFLPPTSQRGLPSVADLIWYDTMPLYPMYGPNRPLRRAEIVRPRSGSTGEINPDIPYPKMDISSLPNGFLGALYFTSSYLRTTRARNRSSPGIRLHAENLVVFPTANRLPGSLLSESKPKSSGR